MKHRFDSYPAYRTSLKHSLRACSVVLASQPSVAPATSPFQGECGSTDVPLATPVVRIAYSFVAAANAAFAASRLKRAENSTEFSAFALQAVRYSFDIKRNAAKAGCSLTVRGADVVRSVKESV